jgi:hypothetical protein
VRIGQTATLRRFWHPQIMPDLSSPETRIKHYENRPRRLTETLVLPTLKPEEPKKLSPGSLDRFTVGSLSNTIAEICSWLYITPAALGSISLFTRG